MRNKAQLLLCILVFVLSTSRAMCAEWKAVAQDGKSREVAVVAKNDDGGEIVVACNQATRMVSIRLDEPRAHWRAGTHMKWITKADEGTKFVPSAGIVTAPTHIVVQSDSILDISTMEKAKTFFIIDVGDYSRIFTAVRLKKSVDPVLRACGDH